MWTLLMKNTKTPKPDSFNMIMQAMLLPNAKEFGPMLGIDTSNFNIDDRLIDVVPVFYTYICGSLTYEAMIAEIGCTKMFNNVTAMEFANKPGVRSELEKYRRKFREGVADLKKRGAFNDLH